jgi:hypothetical protein
MKQAMVMDALGQEVSMASSLPRSGSLMFRRRPKHFSVDISFIGMVEAGRFVDAMAACYADAASVQENGAGPRHGFAALIEHEQSGLAAHAAVRVLPVQA